MQSILDMGAAAERERLRPVLADAVDGMEDMLGYIPEHFRRRGVTRVTWTGEGCARSTRRPAGGVR